MPHVDYHMSVQHAAYILRAHNLLLHDMWVRPLWSVVQAQLVISPAVAGVLLLREKQNKRLYTSIYGIVYGEWPRYEPVPPKPFDYVSLSDVRLLLNTRITREFSSPSYTHARSWSTGPCHAVEGSYTLTHMLFAVDTFHLADLLGAHHIASPSDATATDTP